MAGPPPPYPYAPAPPPPVYAPASPPPPTYLPAPPPRRRRKPLNKGMLLSSVLVVVGVAVTGVALEFPWFSIQATVSGTETWAYYPWCAYITGSTSNTGQGNQGCVSYSALATNGGNLQALYSIIELMVVLALILGVVAFLFGLMGAMGRRLFKRHTHLAFLLAVVAGLLMLMAPLAIAIGQPAAIASESAGAGNTACGSTGPQSSLWGSCTNTSSPESGSVVTNWSWGPSTAWYLSFPAFLLLLLGGMNLRRTEPAYLEEDEESSAIPGTYAVPAGYVAPPLQYPGGPAAPPATPSAPAPPAAPAPYPSGGYGGASGAWSQAPASAPAASVSCRYCGTVNPAGAKVCGRCAQRIY